MIFHACERLFEFGLGFLLFALYSSPAQLTQLNRLIEWPAEKRSGNINGSSNNKHNTPTIIGDLW